MDGIIGTSELIASTDAFQRVWLGNDTGITSIRTFGELVEQLLGDLRLIENAAHFEPVLREMNAYDAVSAFACCLLSIERLATERAEMQDPERLLASPEWGTLRAAALRVISTPAATEFRTHRADIAILPGPECR